ncbi:MAG: MFS transporter [Actinomycetota bacterium]|nr:MFS transporter [Actinomycetota bacterium]
MAIGPLRRNRDFRVLWISQAMSTLGSRVTSIALPLLVLGITGSPARAGLIGFAQTLPFLVFFLPGGALVDRLDRKRLMLASDAARAIAFTTLVVALAWGEPHLLHIAAVALTEGTFFVLFDLSEMAAVPHIVPAHQLPTAIAQNQARLQGADLAGQPLGGVLYEFGRIWPFLFDTVSYVLSFALVATVRPRLQDERPRATTRLHHEVLEGVRWLWAQPFMKWAVALVGGSNFAFSGLLLVLIVRARELQAAPAAIGIMLAGAGLGAILGAAVAPRVQRSIPARIVVQLCLWAWFAGMGVMALVPNLVVLGTLWFAMAIGGPIFNVATGTYTYALVPDHLQGRVRSVYRMVAWGMVPLGTVSGGFLAEWLGAVEAIAVLAGVSLVVAVASTAIRAIRQAPSIQELLDAR